MSRFALEFDTDNAAFADGDRPAEVARILRAVADRIDAGSTGREGAIADINGNRIGSWRDTYPGEDDE